MRLPQQIRYDKIHQAVVDFFENEGITTFPLDPFEIIEANGWGLFTFQELIQGGLLTLSDIEEKITKDGWLFYTEKYGYCIGYNPEGNSEERIKFTLLHEIGHIYLGHLRDFPQTNLATSRLTITEYNILEAEANRFAANALAPAYPFYRLTHLMESGRRLQNIFGLSNLSYRIRLECYEKDYDGIKRFQHEDFYKRFDNFICDNSDFPLCRYCLSIVPHDQASNICLVCEKSKILDALKPIEPIEIEMLEFNEEGGIDMEYKYKDVPMHSNGQVMHCPRCKNADILESDKYCKICGLSVYNECSSVKGSYRSPSCGKTLPGNARFCSSCGNDSIFYVEGILIHWSEEYGDSELPF